MHRAPGGCSSPVPWLRGETPRGTHCGAPAEWPNGIVKLIPRFGGRLTIAREKPSAPAAENPQALAPRAE
ncbi:20S cyclosome subunit [Aspergillus luchuensis]|uniref:20S cyclosome subunit n=1 Tax=Aspergillus kawachii TaxID=1069201 RepID=A0A146FYH8_ASPKA|nr:20S cyclosome subunit [Aspergillus luchuensis]